MEAVLRLTARQLRLLEDACARAGRGETPAAFAVRALAERGDAPAAARPAPIDVPADAVPPGAAAALVLEPGDVLRVEQLAGGQCADLVAWGADDARERLSAARTRALAGAVPGLGARLVSGPPFERPLLELVADTAPGHDLLFPACSPLEYEAVGCLGEPSCAGVQAAAAARFGIAACDVPDPLNLWLHGGVDDAGRLVWRRPATRPGDHVELRALARVLVVVNPCVDDVFGCSALEPSPVVVRVRPGTAAERAAATVAPPPAPAGTPRPLGAPAPAGPPASPGWTTLPLPAHVDPTAARAAAVAAALEAVGP